MIGAATTSAMIRVAESLLDKPGGYLTNDITPPGIYLDNIPNWEFGALVQVATCPGQCARVSAAPSPSRPKIPDLIVAEPNFHFDNDSWIFPATERTSMGKRSKACNPTWPGFPIRTTPTRSSSPAPTTSRPGWKTWKPGSAACPSA